MTRAVLPIQSGAAEAGLVQQSRSRVGDGCDTQRQRGRLMAEAENQHHEGPGD